MSEWKIVSVGCRVYHAQAECREENSLVKNKYSLGEFPVWILGLTVSGSLKRDLNLIFSATMRMGSDSRFHFALSF